MFSRVFLGPRGTWRQRKKVLPGDWKIKAITATLTHPRVAYFRARNRHFISSSVATSHSSSLPLDNSNGFVPKFFPVFSIDYDCALVKFSGSFCGSSFSSLGEIQQFVILRQLSTNSFMEQEVQKRRSTHNSWTLPKEHCQRTAKKLR